MMCTPSPLISMGTQQTEVMRSGDRHRGQAGCRRDSSCMSVGWEGPSSPAYSCYTPPPLPDHSECGPAGQEPDGDGDQRRVQLLCTLWGGMYTCTCKHGNNTPNRRSPSQSINEFLVLVLFTLSVSVMYFASTYRMRCTPESCICCRLWLEPWQSIASYARDVWVDSTTIVCGWWCAWAARITGKGDQPQQECMCVCVLARAATNGGETHSPYVCMCLCMNAQKCTRSVPTV